MKKQCSMIIFGLFISFVLLQIFGISPVCAAQQYCCSCSHPVDNHDPTTKCKCPVANQEECANFCSETPPLYDWYYIDPYPPYSCTNQWCTVITLGSFTATPGNKIVKLKWSTETEIDCAGFNIYRADSEDDSYVRVNDTLIPPEVSSTQGATYGIVDEDVKNGKKYYYKLEDIDLDGKTTMHDSVTATPRLIYGIFGK